jgi:hypothetical protein
MEFMTDSVASPNKECMKSALPKVPVIRGGTGPFGEFTSTSSMSVSAKEYQSEKGATVFADMTKNFFVTHLSQCQFAPVAVC